MLNVFGYWLALFLMVVFLSVAAVLFYRKARAALRISSFSPDIMKYLGMCLFFFVHGIYVLWMLMGEEDIINAILYIWRFYWICLLPVALVFSLSFMAAHISLMMREGMRFEDIMKSLLGLIMTGTSIILGMVWYWLLNFDYMPVIISVIMDLFLLVAICLECLLLAAMAAGVWANKCTHTEELDYVIILGCAIEEDGRLRNSIRKRVERAIRAYEENGNIVLVPSGGQGPDESISEAEAMARYIYGRGIPADHVIPEDKSTTTYENLLYSVKIIEDHAGRKISDLQVGIATTDYHIYRAGMIARSLGYRAYGLGTAVLGHYWPNGYIREFAGIIKFLL